MGARVRILSLWDFINYSSECSAVIYYDVLNNYLYFVNRSALINSLCRNNNIKFRDTIRLRLIKSSYANHTK